MAEEFPTLYQRHVRHVLTGDTRAALADLVPGRIPAVFEGVTVPRGHVDDLRIVDVRRSGEKWIGETVYETPGGPVGLRSIWIRHEGAWKADALENFQTLAVQRCRSCAAWLWTPRPLCPSCYGFDLDWEPVAAEGTVFSWCRSHHSYVEELETPYTTVLAELPAAGGIRVLGLLADDSAAPTIGDRVVGDVAASTVRWRVA